HPRRPTRRSPTPQRTPLAGSPPTTPGPGLNPGGGQDRRPLLRRSISSSAASTMTRRDCSSPTCPVLPATLLHRPARHGWQSHALHPIGRSCGHLPLGVRRLRFRPEVITLAVVVPAVPPVLPRCGGAARRPVLIPRNPRAYTSAGAAWWLHPDRRSELGSPRAGTCSLRHRTGHARGAEALEWVTTLAQQLRLITMTTYSGPARLILT